MLDGLRQGLVRPAPFRSGVKKALELHLKHKPTRVSRSRIKRLRGLSRPQYRLRVGDIRVFYDVKKRKSRSSPSSRKPKRRHGSTPKGSHAKPREVALAAVKDDLSKYLRLAASEEIVRYRYGTGLTRANYDVDLDSERFLMVKSDSEWLNLVLNWHEQLKRLAPAEP
jgi:hypothetical protein